MSLVVMHSLLTCLVVCTPPSPPLRDVAILTQQIKEHPDNPHLYFRRGEGFFLKGDMDRALADFNEAIRLDPTRRVVYDARLWVYENKGDYDRMLEEMATMIGRFPNAIAVYRKRAHVLADHKKDVDGAIADMDCSIRLNSKVPELFEERGDLFFKKGRYDQALADYDQSIRLYSEPHQLDNGMEQRADSRSACRGYLRRGDVRYVQQEYGQALEEYKKSLQQLSYFLKPQERIAWMHATCPDQRFRNGKEALFAATIKLHPGCYLTPIGKAQSYSLRAAACAELGQFKEAADCEAKAMGVENIDPEYISGARERLALYLAEKPCRLKYPPID